MLQEKDLAKKCVPRQTQHDSKTEHLDKNECRNELARPALLCVDLRNGLLVFHRLSPFIRDRAFRGRHPETPPRQPPRFFVNSYPVPLLFGHV